MKRISLIFLLGTVLILNGGCAKVLTDGDTVVTNETAVNPEDIRAVPNILGMSDKDAHKAIENAGLTWKDTNIGHSENKLVRQYNPKGNVEKGTLIYITYDISGKDDDVVDMSDFGVSVTEKTDGALTKKPEGQTGLGSIAGVSNYIPDPASSRDDMVKCTHSVFIRLKPDKNSQVLGTFVLGQYGLLLDTDESGWINIRTADGIEGWVWKDYVNY
jgi:hypothetical protein